jgi:hypothetical protein
MTEHPINHIDHIKAWLKSHGRDRFWLADQLNVHKRTADNWLSAGQSIPEAKLALIKRLMADDEAAALRRKQQLDPIAQVFSLEVDLPTFRAYSQAAKAQRLTLEEWSIAELNSAAEQWFAQGKPSPSHLFPPFTSNVLNEPPAKPFTDFEKALILKAQAVAQAQAAAPAASGDNPADSQHSTPPDHTESTSPPPNTPLPAAPTGLA